MVNYACAFSQSESGKYFEYIIVIYARTNEITIQGGDEVMGNSGKCCFRCCHSERENYFINKKGTVKH